MDFYNTKDTMDSKYVYEEALKMRQKKTADNKLDTESTLKDKASLNTRM